MEITAFKKEVAKIGLSANSSISIRFYYVSGKMVRKIVLNLSNLQTCRPNIKKTQYTSYLEQQQQLTTPIQACGSVDDRSQQTQQCDKDAPQYRRCSGCYWTLQRSTYRPISECSEQSGVAQRRKLQLSSCITLITVSQSNDEPINVADGPREALPHVHGLRLNSS